MNVKNEKYVNFLKGGLMETTPRNKFEEILPFVQHKQLVQARALVITLWMTGARPIEILNLTAGDFELDGSHLKIKIKTAKRGIGRVIELPLKDPLVKEIWSYAKDKLAGFFLFWAFRSKSKKSFTSVKIKKKGTDGSIETVHKRYEKSYEDISDRLHHWFKKWFNLPPYYFRHNRFTIMADYEDNIERLRQTKGAKGYDSVLRYMHSSAKSAKKTGKFLVK